jgi:hypothetical protein
MIHTDARGFETLCVFDPFPIVPLFRVVLGRDELLEVSKKYNAMLCSSLTDLQVPGVRKISFNPIPEGTVISKRIEGTDVNVSQFVDDDSDNVSDEDSEVEDDAQLIFDI